MDIDGRRYRETHVPAALVSVNCLWAGILGSVKCDTNLSVAVVQDAAVNPWEARNPGYSFAFSDGIRWWVQKAEVQSKYDGSDCIPFSVVYSSQKK